MGENTLIFNNRSGLLKVDPESVLNALAIAIVVIDGQGKIIHVNTAGEQFFKSSASHIKGLKLQGVLPGDSPLFDLINQARKDNNVVSEYGVTLDTPRIGRHFLNIQAMPLAEIPDAVVIS
ncbi:MAG TPA: PAS domain-containing protein, partial [Rhodospirillales bacterium]|nr:PAS domain-containing protein [Rhodospirillales bacterium]